MYAMIEAGLRGGMTQTTCKEVEANNKYAPNDYDSSMIQVKKVVIQTFI